MFNKILKFIQGHIAADDNSVENRFGGPEHTLWDVEIGLRHLSGTHIIEKRHGSGELMLYVIADPFISAFSKGGHIFEDLQIFGVEIDVEMICLILIPVKFGIENFVLSEVRKVNDLGHAEMDHRKKKDKKKDIFCVFFHLAPFFNE
jgi:hypothetical protein